MENRGCIIHPDLDDEGFSGFYGVMGVMGRQPGYLHTEATYEGYDDTTVSQYEFDDEGYVSKLTVRDIRTEDGAAQEETTTYVYEYEKRD